MKQLFGIIGLGRFGRSVAQRLIQLNKEVICIDKNEDIIRDLSEDITNIYQADCLDEKAMQEIGMSEVNVAVVSIGEDIETSIMAVAILHNLGVMNIYAKAVNVLHGRILAKVGAKRVIFPEKEMGENLANTLAGVDIIDYLGVNNSYIFAKIKPPKQFIGKTIKNLDIRNIYGINIIGIEKNRQLNINPNPNEVLEENDTLMAIGSKDDINKLIKL